MQYTILKVDDSRKRSVDKIHAAMVGWDFVGTPTVDGRNPQALEEAKEEWGLGITPAYHFNREGQLGYWYSALNAMRYAAFNDKALLVFEDDAILCEDFESEFAKRADVKIPDMDFFMLYVPPERKNMYKPKHDVGYANVCRVYQPYGGVAIFYTPKGAQKILDLVRRDGLKMQHDNALCNYSWNGELNGYTSKPFTKDLIMHPNEDVSIIQTSKEF